MLARVAKSVTRVARNAPIRNFGWVNAPLSKDFTYTDIDGRLIRNDGVVITDTYPSLEWLLDDPPSLHQFEEPPIVVEVEHLDNLVPYDPAPEA